MREMLKDIRWKALKEKEINEGKYDEIEKAMDKDSKINREMENRSAAYAQVNKG